VFVASNTFSESKIYTTVDANGNVVFMDVPPRADAKAEAVDIKVPNTFQPDDILPTQGGRAPWILQSEGEDGDESASPSYHSLAIRSPSDNANIRENAATSR
jgi:hypothetical protein